MRLISRIESTPCNVIRNAVQNRKSQKSRSNESLVVILGGAIVTWAHFVGFNPYVVGQHISSNGLPLWRTGGISVSMNYGMLQEMDPDGEHGAFVVWGNRVQRLSPQGELLWGTDGVTLTDKAMANAILSYDGAHGAYVTWQEYVATGVSDSNVFAQHLQPDGQPLWGNAGVNVITGTDFQGGPRVIPDGYGGAIVSWVDTVDNSSDTEWSLYTQRLDAAGSVQWNHDGIKIADHSGMRGDSALVSDSWHGMVAVWTDWLNDPLGNLYAQRISEEFVLHRVFLPIDLKH